MADRLFLNGVCLSKSEAYDVFDGIISFDWLQEPARLKTCN
jgi:hypothetical protein